MMFFTAVLIFIDIERPGEPGPAAAPPAPNFKVLAQDSEWKVICDQDRGILLYKSGNSLVATAPGQCNSK